MRLLIVCTLMCISVPAHAADWLPVGKTTTGSQGWIDFKSIDWTKSDRRSGWVKWDNSKDRRVKAHMTMELVEAGCSSNQMRTVRWVAYDAAGTVVRSGPVYASTLDFEPVIPESMGEIIFSALCADPHPISATDSAASDEN